MSAVLVGISLVAVVLVALVRGAVGGVVTGEVSGWLPHLSRRLVQRVARRLPPEQQERAEEWEAEVAEYADRPLTALMIAVRIWCDRRAIVNEAAEPVSPAAKQEVAEEVAHTLANLDPPPLALTGTATGFRELDELTGGFQPGNLVVIAARPSMGKSALVTNIAENAAIDHQRSVALFSLEMSEAELAMRFIASQARVKGDDLSKGRAEKRWPKILEASQRLARAPIFVDDASDVGILDIGAKAHRLHSQVEGGLGLVIIDSLELLRVDVPSAVSRF